MYALIDCNNFFASCERIFKPQLNNKPIVVLSNNDGCVIARSNEAKALGIPMGAPAFEYKEIFEKNNVHVFSSNYELYGDISNRVMNIVSEYSPEVEVYSIDECFLYFKGFDEFFNLKEMGTEIRSKVLKWTGIPISIGFAPTKALAKAANKIAKKFPEQTNGVHIIDNEDLRIKALKWTKIEDVWGIGRQHAKRLKAIQINNALQFSQMDDSWVRKNMSVVGLRLKHDLMGKSSIPMEDIHDKKQIAVTRSFEKMLSDLPNLSERISTFSTVIGEKLRKQNSHCNLITVFINSNYFRKDLKQHRAFFTIKTEFPTSSTFEINRLAQGVLKSIFKEGIQYKKAGVIVGGITPSSNFQMNIFIGENPKHQNLMKVIDSTNKRFGGKIKFGNNDLKRRWKMKQEKLSPCYSTRFEDIITVNCK